MPLQTASNHIYYTIEYNVRRTAQFSFPFQWKKLRVLTGLIKHVHRSTLVSSMSTFTISSWALDLISESS